MHTTFAELHKARACTNRYRHLAKALGGITRYGKHTPITALQILNVNGLEDCLWAARLMPNDRLWREFACDCAEQERVVHMTKDQRNDEVLAVTRRFAIGEASEAELTAAWDEAWTAVWAAVWDEARTAAMEWQTKRLRWYLTECEWGPRQEEGK
jgi:hypothetical protein